MQIRYEGILSAVDPVNKSMTLVGVRSFGSEGRRSGQNEVPANESEISEVTFKIEHIKDFKIVEKPNTMLIDPAIISSSNTAKTGDAEEKKDFYSKFPTSEFPKQQSSYHRGGHGNYHRNNNRGNNRGPVGELESNPNPKLKEAMKENFDFASHTLTEEQAQASPTKVAPTSSEEVDPA